MSKRRWMVALAIVLCALLPPTTLIAKKQVERPLRIQTRGVTDLIEGTAVMTGVTTHGGRFTNVAWLTGPDTAEGWLTGANGDKVHWTAISIVTPPIAPPQTEYSVNLSVTIIGGTGQFEGASGGFTATYTAIVDWGAMTMTYSFVGTGTITY